MDGGRTYYYHAEKQETQWTMPVEFEVTPDEANPDLTLTLTLTPTLTPTLSLTLTLTLTLTRWSPTRPCRRRRRRTTAPQEAPQPQEAR